jgi:hypothetical protein
MPMHDWTRVEPTIYHHFHQACRTNEDSTRRCSPSLASGAA